MNTIMPADQVRELADIAALECLAEELGDILGPGDVVLLEGPIGVGKTRLVSAFVAALGSTDQVTSPTYTLMHVYETPSLPVLHLDAYRLSGVAEYLDLGAGDFAHDSITMVEWGDRVADAHPEHLGLVLEFGRSGETSRRCTIRRRGRSWPLPDTP